MPISTFCIVSTDPQAAAIVNRLKACGFANSDISVLLPAKRRTGIRERFRQALKRGQRLQDGILIAVNAQTGEQINRVSGVFREAYRTPARRTF